MTTLFVRHQVNDFATWKDAYIAFDPARKRLGAVDAAVYQAADNPNDVTVTHEFQTLDAAQRFAQSDELQQAMAAAGVAGEPTVWFANRN